ncbi:MAG: DUF4124 domain-containing protein [Burkholderiales bacterium]
MTRLVFFFLALLGATGAQAQVYKCIDPAGKTVYLQTPCPAGSRSATLGRKVPEAPAPAAAEKAAAKSGPKSVAEQEQAFRKRQEEQQKAQKKNEDSLAESKEKEDNCRRARAQLTQYEIGGRISRYDEKGERYFLDDDQINQEKTKARSLVDQWCK